MPAVMRDRHASFPVLFLCFRLSSLPFISYFFSCYLLAPSPQHSWLTLAVMRDLGSWNPACCFSCFLPLFLSFLLCIYLFFLSCFLLAPSPQHSWLTLAVMRDLGNRSPACFFSCCLPFVFVPSIYLFFFSCYLLAPRPQHSWLTLAVMRDLGNWNPACLFSCSSFFTAFASLFAPSPQQSWLTLTGMRNLGNENPACFSSGSLPFSVSPSPFPFSLSPLPQSVALMADAGEGCGQRISRKGAGAEGRAEAATFGRTYARSGGGELGGRLLGEGAATGPCACSHPACQESLPHAAACGKAVSGVLVVLTLAGWWCSGRRREGWSGPGTARFVPSPTTVRMGGGGRGGASKRSLYVSTWRSLSMEWMMWWCEFLWIYI